MFRCHSCSTQRKRQSRASRLLVICTKSSKIPISEQLKARISMGALTRNLLLAGEPVFKLH